MRVVTKSLSARVCRSFHLCPWAGEPIEASHTPGFRQPLFDKGLVKGKRSGLERGSSVVDIDVVFAFLVDSRAICTQLLHLSDIFPAATRKNKHIKTTAVAFMFLYDFYPPQKKHKWSGELKQIPSTPVSNLADSQVEVYPQRLANSAFVVFIRACPCYRLLNMLIFMEVFTARPTRRFWRLRGGWTVRPPWTSCSNACSRSTRSTRRAGRMKYH